VKAPNLKALIKDKKFLGVVAVGSLVGVYALTRNRTGDTTSSAASDAGVAGSSGAGGTPTFSDGGTDIAASLGNFSVELQGILQNFVDAQKPATIPPKTTTPTTPTAAQKAAAAAAAKARAAALAAAKKKLQTGKPAPTTSYKIKKGDTLSEIAQRNHTTTGALAKLNGIKNVNLIYAGRTLKVPKKK
jgi:LysM repeat protein